MRTYQIPQLLPTTTKSIRFRNNIIEQVEKELQGQNCTFSAFIIEAVRFALNSLEENRK